MRYFQNSKNLKRLLKEKLIRKIFVSKLTMVGNIKCRIHHQFTCLNMPRYNGVAETKNRHLAKICQSLLYGKISWDNFWAEAIKTSVFVINRLRQQRLHFLSHFVKLWNIKYCVSYFCILRYVCYVFVPNNLHKVVRCIFVGYDNQRKG